MRADSDRQGRGVIVDKWKFLEQEVIDAFVHELSLIEWAVWRQMNWDESYSITPNYYPYW